MFTFCNPFCNSFSNPFIIFRIGKVGIEVDNKWHRRKGHFGIQMSAISSDDYTVLPQNCIALSQRDLRIFLTYIIIQRSNASAR